MSAKRKKLTDAQRFDEGVKIGMQMAREDLASRARTPICAVDMDTAAYVGSEEDGVYYSVAEGSDGWYTSSTVDCNSAHFCDALVTDDGPYATETEAWEAGLRGAVDWCLTNDVAFEEAGS